MSELVAKLHRCVNTGNLDFSIFGDLDANKTALQECEVLDFKQQLPEGDLMYAKTIRDAVALHNSYGGFLVFGVREVAKDRDFEIVGVPPQTLQQAKLRDLALEYLGHDLRLAASSQLLNGKIVEVLWIAKRSIGDTPMKFIKNGPEEKPGKPCFKRDHVVFRRLQSNAVAEGPEDYDFLYSLRQPPSIERDSTNFVEETPLEHNLPDRAFVCSRFVGRRADLGGLWTWLADNYSRVRLIAGEGGLGKTSLAYRFVEEVASRRVKPFQQIVWLTAKKNQFLAFENSYRQNLHTDFQDAKSLYTSIARAHGCIEEDFNNLDSNELRQLALNSCANIPSFIVVDDVDSLSKEDQQRTLTLGMNIPSTTKMLLTTRVNFSYAPENVLKLNGLAKDEFVDYVKVVRGRYGLPSIKESKIEYLREVSGGSPLFTDSLLRLERQGLPLDQAINQWKKEKGLEARKAALHREVDQLSREAKRTLYVISHVKSASYVELSQILIYTEQTLGDALQELAGLFLVSAPSIGREARYTIEPNTGLLVLELGKVLEIDHVALLEKIRRTRTDAIGISSQKRSGIVGLAIAQASALLKENNPKAALEAVLSASKRLSKPNADLLLAIGRFNLKLIPPNRDYASKVFDEAYLLGQRKQLLFDLWFEAEYGRGSLETALEVTAKAVEHQIGDVHYWFERSAQTHIALAHRSGTKISKDSAIREVDLAIFDLHKAKESCVGAIQNHQMDILINQAHALRIRLSIGQ